MKNIYKPLFCAAVALFVSAVFAPFGAQAATLVASTSANGTMTFPAVNASSGNAIVVFTKNESGDPTSVHDSAGNIYTKIGCKDITTVLSGCMWYAKNITGSASLVVSSTLSKSSFPRMLLWEFSGLDTVNPFDASSTQTGTNTAPITTPSLTTNGTDVVVGGLATEGGSLTAINAGAILGASSTQRFGAVGVDTGGEDAENLAPGTGMAAISWSGSAPSEEVLISAAFKTAQAGPAITSFIASPSTISLGSSTTLSWNVSNVSSAAIDTGVGSITIPTGTIVVSPAVTTMYTLTASSSNGTSAIAHVTVTVNAPDTTPPTVSVASPVNAALVHGIITVSSTASDNVGVTGVQFYLDGAPLGALDTAAPYSISWNTSTTTDGTHVLSASAMDAAGNVGTSTPITVTVDNQAPTGSVVIDGGATATNSTAATLTLSATDDLGTVSFMRFSNTGTSFSTPQAYATTASWTLTTGTGVKTVYAQFQDPAGNWSAAVTSTITMDTTAPTISAVTATNITGNSATITWTTNEPATSQVNYGLTTSYGATTTLDTNLVTVHSVLVSGLSPSTKYHYRARSKDAAGNEKVGSDVTFTTTAVVDTQAPSVPANLAAVATSSSQINLMWTSSTDNVGVAGYQIFRNGSQVGTSTVTSYSDTGLAAVTTYTYTVTAFDAAKNISGQSSSTSAMTLLAPDTTAPVVSMTAPAPSSTVSGTSTLVSADAADPVVAGQVTSGVASVQFLLDGAPLGAAVTSSPYAMNWDTTGATNGAHALSAKATDASGNAMTSASVTVDVENIDTTAPSAPINLSATAISSSQINLSWTASTDPDNAQGQLSYGVFRNGVQVATTTAGATAFSDTDLVASTTYSYTLTAQDPAGNVSTQSSSTSATTLASTPVGLTMVQTVHAGKSAQPATVLSIPLPNASLSNNLLVFGFTIDHGVAVSSVTDNQGNTWNVASSKSDATNGFDTYLYYTPGATAGVTKITLTLGSATNDVTWDFSEFSGVATVSPVDGTPVASLTSGPSLTAGPITTTQAGDLIYNRCVAVNGIGGVLGFASVKNIAPMASGTLLATDISNLGVGTEMYVQPAAGTVNPSMTYTGFGDAAHCTAVAFKTASAGTPHGTGIHIDHLSYTWNTPGGSSAFEMPYTGNLLVLTDSNTGATLNSVADSNGDTWHITGAGGEALSPKFAYAQNVPGAPGVLLATTTYNNSAAMNFMVYDVSGAASSSYDTDTFNSGGEQTGVNAPIPDAVSITPSTPNGLVIEVTQFGEGPSTGVTSPTEMFDCTWYPGSTDSERFCNGDGYSHTYNTGTSTLQTGWTMANNTVSSYSGRAVAFKATNQ